MSNSVYNLTKDINGLGILYFHKSQAIEAAEKLAAIETPIPELDPPDSKTFRPYGLRVCPPIELYPTGHGLQK